MNIETVKISSASIFKGDFLLLYKSSSFDTRTKYPRSHPLSSAFEIGRQIPLFAEILTYEY